MVKSAKQSGKPVNRFRQRIGSWGEDIAADYLQKQGFSIIGRNVRTAYGEIDLIAQCDQCDNICNGRRPLTVFVEVKTRRSLNFGYPEQAVNTRKIEHLLASAHEYIQRHPEISGDWRVDVIAILINRNGVDPEIVVFENAITG